MAVDIAELVGQDNMQLARKEQVIAILHNIPDLPTTKRYLYSRWARLLGVHPERADLDRVAPWGQ